MSIDFTWFYSQFIFGVFIFKPVITWTNARNSHRQFHSTNKSIRFWRDLKYEICEFGDLQTVNTFSSYIVYEFSFLEE